MTPLQSRLQPCSGWAATVCAAPRSAPSADGHPGRCGHIGHVYFRGGWPVAAAAASGGSKGNVATWYDVVSRWGSSVLKASLSSPGWLWCVVRKLDGDAKLARMLIMTTSGGVNRRPEPRRWRRRGSTCLMPTATGVAAHPRQPEGSPPRAPIVVMTGPTGTPHRRGRSSWGTPRSSTMPPSAHRPTMPGPAGGHGVVTSADVVSGVDRSWTDEKRPIMRSDQRQPTDEQGAR
jgi:hypothetical protein